MITPHFSHAIRASASSALRDLFKITESPQVISFAGGLPSSTTFPLKTFEKACQNIFAREPEMALQYGPTDGSIWLRERIAADHGVRPDQVILTTGSQQALDLLGKIFIDPNAPIYVETPSYLGAIQAFAYYQPQFTAIPSDVDGVIVDQIPAVEGARFLYLLPNFQNPTGKTLTLERRRALVEWAAREKVFLIEDNPYGELYYDGEPLPTLYSMNPDVVIYLGSFSKVLAPGLRVGYVIAPQEVVAMLSQGKQVADLHTSSFTQRLVLEVLESGIMPEHLRSVRTFYAQQAQVMMQALQSSMPSDIRWTQPIGGMFTWVTMPSHIDSDMLLQQAIRQNIAFVPSAPFYAVRPEKNHMRVSFATVSPENIQQGMQTLAQLIRDAL